VDHAVQPGKLSVDNAILQAQRKDHAPRR
jgi:hypothetical protein